MEAYNFCQSCGMPLDREDFRGTERDGTKSTKYCKFCYSGGEFVDPGMTLEQMKIRARTKLEEMHLPESVIQQAILTLPMLGRWMGGVRRIIR
ncbi:MAG TPA: zinc ribbon domain-containing protein [Puia sp.]|nr:zinc ribbon domain-containing protein [Puia sp.]